MNIKQIARTLCKVAAGGSNMFTMAGLVDVCEGDIQEANELISEALARNIVERKSTGICYIRNINYLQELAEADREVGDPVTVVHNGKKFSALVKERTPEGSYKLSFGDDKPDDEDKEYTEDEFGEAE